MRRELPMQPNHLPPTAAADRQHRQRHERLPLNTESLPKHCSSNFSTKTNPVALHMHAWYPRSSHTLHLSPLAQPSSTNPSGSVRFCLTFECKSFAVGVLTTVCAGSATDRIGTGLAAVHSGHHGAHP